MLAKRAMVKKATMRAVQLLIQLAQVRALALVPLLLLLTQAKNAKRNHRTQRSLLQPPNPNPLALRSPQSPQRPPLTATRTTTAIVTASRGRKARAKALARAA